MKQVLLFALASTAIFAQDDDRDRGFYLGVHVGLASLDERGDCYDCYYKTDDDAAFTRGLRVGFQFNPYIAIELSRMSWSNTDDWDYDWDDHEWYYDDDDFDDIEGRAIKVRGYVPLGLNSSFFGHVGVHHVEVGTRVYYEDSYRSTYREFDDFGVNGGIGFEWEIGRSSAISIECNYYDVEEWLDIFDNRPDYDLFEVVVGWRWIF